MKDESTRDVVAGLRSSEPGERLRALGRLMAAPRPLHGDLVDAVLACLWSETKAERRGAVEVLHVAGAAQLSDIVARLQAACQGGDPGQRWGAAYALGSIGVLSPTLVTPLIEALAQRDGDQRWAAARLTVACGRMHPDVVVPALLAALADAGSELRKMILYVLRDLRPGRLDQIVPVFLRSLSDPERGVRLAALSAVCGLDPPPRETLDRVLRMIRDDPDLGVRRAAMSGLGIIGRGVGAARDAVEQALGSPDEGLRRAAEHARRRLAFGAVSGG